MSPQVHNIITTVVIDVWSSVTFVYLIIHIVLQVGDSRLHPDHPPSVPCLPWSQPQMQPNHFAFVRLLACFRDGPSILLLLLSFYCFKECFNGAPFTAASSPDSIHIYIWRYFRRAQTKLHRKFPPARPPPGPPIHLTSKAAFSWEQLRLILIVVFFPRPPG